eukprot:GHVS01050970.1.p2 GENE.GHVS01050970.1~~GHVS01050970.1.p2  ORF type:complete len:433 (+),score=89.33 GHVS01050970.1:499-1797(+)
MRVILLRRRWFVFLCAHRPMCVMYTFRDLQEVIMNYFTVSGCEEAAAAFAEEAAIQSEMPVESMGLRKKIRQAVMTGNVTKAIACINRIEPKILEGNPELSFRLKQQQLLQLIEMGDSQQAISFAQEELAPSVKLHPELLPELEKSMSLLFFSDLSSKTAQRLSGGVGQREDAAERIDDEILDFYNIEKESTLEMMVKDLILTQQQLERSSAEYISRSQESSNYEHLPTFRSTAHLPSAHSPTSPPSSPHISYSSCSPCTAPIRPLVSVSPSLCPLLIDIPTGAISSSSVPSSLRPVRSGAAGNARRALTPSPPPHRAPAGRDSGPSSSASNQRRSRPSESSLSSVHAPSSSSASQTSPSFPPPPSTPPTISPPARGAPQRALPRDLIIVQGGGRVGGEEDEGDDNEEAESGREGEAESRRDGGSRNRGGRS